MRADQHAADHRSNHQTITPRDRELAALPGMIDVGLLHAAGRDELSMRWGPRRLRSQG